jgi:phosphoribosylamine--glycine ligase/phosphoribosylformylglycinamidine cyclo-ligase
MASSGIHSNGFSMVRKIVERFGLQYTDPSPWSPNRKTYEDLLIPTRIYVRSCLQLARKKIAKGFAHITGGGLTDNIPRILPKNLGAKIDLSSWKFPQIFRWLMEKGNVETKEMLRTFNCGIGMVAVVDPKDAKEACQILTSCGEQVFEIGKIVAKRNEQQQSVEYC